jgi:hypothetical protein
MPIFREGLFSGILQDLDFKKNWKVIYLPNVNEYTIPFNDVIEKNNAAKLVYEFDAADVMKSYMYPAMARSFQGSRHPNCNPFCLGSYLYGAREYRI